MYYCIISYSAFELQECSNNLSSVQYLAGQNLL